MIKQHLLFWFTHKAPIDLFLELYNDIVYGKNSFSLNRGL